MSSIRLFILSSFAQHGPMHGHRLRVEAERKKVDVWTDISVGAVYGAMNRLAAEGLLREAGREQEGNRPPRQLYEITDEGLRVLAELRQEGLTQIWFKADPFDLALTRLDPSRLEEFRPALAARLDRVRAMLEERQARNAYARDYIGLAQEWALRHAEYRLEAEVAFLQDLLAAADQIVADERNPRPVKPKPYK